MPDTISLKRARDLIAKGIDVSDFDIHDEDGTRVELVIEKATAPADKQKSDSDRTAGDKSADEDGTKSRASHAASRDDGRVHATAIDWDDHRKGLLYQVYEALRAKRSQTVTTNDHPWLPGIGDRLKSMVGSVRRKATETANVADFTPTVVAPIQALIYESDFLQALTPTPMGKSVVSIPQIVEATGSGAGVGPTSEGSTKPAKVYEAADVKLEAEAYGATAAVSNLAMLDFAAFENWVTTKLLGRVSDKLEGRGISRIKTGDHLVDIDMTVNGEVTVEEALKMRLFMMGGRQNWVYLMHPTAFEELTEVDKTAAFWFGDTDGLDRFRGIPVIYTHALDSVDEAGGTPLVLANTAMIAWGVYTEPQSQFNPFFGWTTNESSVRVEGFMDIKPAINTTYTGQDGAATDGVEIGHFVAIRNTA